MLDLSNNQVLNNIKAKINWKIILVIVGIILIGEGIWAVFQMKLFSQADTATAINDSATAAKILDSTVPYLALQTNQTTVKSGETISVNIYESSLESTDGTDVVIKYDPKVLEVIPATALKAAAQITNLYEAYPVNRFEESSGIMLLSGVTSNINGVIAKGVLGTVNFKAKAIGKTAITIDFQPGKTVDSNIIETKKSLDILKQVQNLEITIN